MTQEQQCIAIAEACGWRATGYYWLPPEHNFWFNVIRDKNGLPEFLTDLNAMAEAEKVLTIPQRNKMADLLDDGNGGHFATAAQRAEAFLKMIVRWKETV